jgi:hypothetical protein
MSMAIGDARRSGCRMRWLLESDHRGTTDQERACLGNTSSNPLTYVYGRHTRLRDD